MKRVLSLLLVLLLTLNIGAAAVAEEEKKDPVGTVEGGVYTNQAFGFRMVLPENWRFWSDAQIAQQMGYPAEYASREGLASVLAQTSGVCAMFASATDDAVWNANLMIQDLGAYSYLDEQTYFNYSKDELAGALQPQGFTNIQVTESSFRLVGKEHVGAVLTADLGDFHLYMIVTVIKAETGYMGTLTVAAASREKAEAVLGYFEPLDSAEPVPGDGEAYAYENKMLDIAAEFDPDWYVLNEAERAQLSGLVIQSSTEEDMTKLLSDALETGKTVCDMSVRRQDGTGDNINVTLENMGIKGVLMDEKTYCESGKGVLEQYFRQMGCDKLSLAGEEIDFCGEVHYSLLLQASLNGQNFYERQIYIKAGTYMGILNIFSTDEARLAAMVDMFRPIAAD